MELKELYRGCRSYRRFLQKPVDKDIIIDAVDNARIASSARNAQNLRYIAVMDPDNVKALHPCMHYAGSLPKETGMPKEDEQPVAFIVLIEKEGSGAFIDVDAGIAANMIVNTLYEKGVGSCILGAVNFKEVKEILSIEENDTPRLVIALGYPSHTSTIVEPSEDGSVMYYLDEEKNYCVPKRNFEDIVSFK